jgi:RHS repeat-associated protein
MQCRAPTSATTCAGATPTGAKLAYDAERRLSHWQNAQSNPTTQAWYMYNGSGQRVEQYVSGGSGNHTYYLPGGVEEVTPSGSLSKHYAAGGMALGLNTAHDASGISYLASDGLGSVSEALSPGGSATGTVLYSPYGGVRYTSGTMPTSRGFTGQYSDAASTGLDYYGARYYDPSLGQFTSADTVSDGINRYGYVQGNPETYTDPTGHRMNCDTGYCDKPPPSGDGGGGGGDCTSDATCDKNGTGDKCEGNKACSPAKPPRCRPVCETGTHQEGGLLSLSGYDTSQLTVVGVDGIDFLVGLLEDLLGSIQTRAQAVGGGIDAILAFLAAISAVAPPLIPLIAGVAAANTVAFTVLYMRAEDNVHHIIAYLKAVEGVVSDNPELRDTIVVNLVEKRLPDPPINLPLSGQNNLRALGVDWGTLYVSSPQITGASGLWPPMP